MAEIREQGVYLPDDDEEGALDLALAEQERNDLGNAERFLARHRDDVRFVRKIDWHVWNGQRWKIDGAADLVRQRAHQTTREIKCEAAACEKRQGQIKAQVKRLRDEGAGESDPAVAEAINESARMEGLKGALWGWSIESGEGRRIGAMIREAQPYLGVEPQTLDDDPLLINLENGMLRLEGACEELLTHDRGRLCAKLMPVKFDAEAVPRGFLRFLYEVQPNQRVRDFLQRYAGYCLTGLTGEQVMVFNFGDGSNGKSVFVEIIARIMGDYALTLPFASLVRNDKKRGGDATPDLARLPGKRLVRASEPELGARLGEATIKSLTGEEEITARHLNEGFFDFQPTHKLMISGNHKPYIRGTDHGIWRRLILVPWDVKIAKDRQDRDLANKLWRERSGILNWILDGCRMYLEGGLQVPEEISAATEAFRQESDPVGRFLDDCTEQDPGGWVTAAEIFENYKGWCKANGEREWSQTALGRALPEHGLERQDGRVRRYLGIRLIPMPSVSQASGGPPAHYQEPDGPEF